MPTFERLPRFAEDYSRLTADEKDLFWEAVRAMIEDLKAGRRIRHDLRPKRVHHRKQSQLWEITWAKDGRAVFMYGSPRLEGEAHIVWLRVGSHGILKAPMG